MPDAKLLREVRDHAPLRTDQQHARVHVGHVTHDPIINPTDASTSTNIKPDDTESGINQEMDQGTRIRRARQRAGLTQTQLARQLDVRQSAVSQWEKGTVRPLIATAIKLAAFLHLPLSDVLPEAGNIPEDAFRDPQVLRLVERFVRLPLPARSAIELFVADLEERLRPPR